MKNYWLIAGGITIGLGVAHLKKEESKTESILMILGGTAVVLVGIYGFKNK
jgi:hypothetical membrane protein